jgi:hypothetical protein
MHYGTLMLPWLAEAFPSPRSLESPPEDCLFGKEEARVPNGSDHFLLKHLHQAQMDRARTC